jgi:hypothetical protein
MDVGVSGVASVVGVSSVFRVLIDVVVSLPALLKPLCALCGLLTMVHNL